MPPVKDPWAFVEKRCPGGKAAWNEADDPIELYQLGYTGKPKVALATDLRCQRAGVMLVTCQCKAFIDGQWVLRKTLPRAVQLARPAPASAPVPPRPPAPVSTHGKWLWRGIWRNSAPRDYDD